MFSQVEIIHVDTTLGNELIVIKTRGEAVLDNALPTRFLYAFDEYMPVKIVFKNGTTASSRININLITGKLLFIDRTGEVLQISNQEEIRLFYESGNTWVPAENTYGRIIYEKEGIAVICIVKTEISNYQIETAFGGKSNTSSAQSLLSITTGNISHPIIPVGEFTFKIKRLYYILKGGRRYFSNTTSLKKLFSEKKKKINNFLKVNKINLQNETDLLKVLDLLLERV